MKIQELTECENCIVNEMKEFPLVAWCVLGGAQHQRDFKMT